MQGCESGRFIPDPDFFLFRIPDPTTATKVEGIQICSTYFCIHKYHKVKNIFNIWTGTDKIWVNSQRIIVLLRKTLSLSPPKYGFGIRDQRSWIKDPEKIYFESQILGSKRHRNPDPGHRSATLLQCKFCLFLGTASGGNVRLRSSSTHCFEFFLLISSRFLRTFCFDTL
jgi:hypothetical protein